ncbi:2-acylglycerol O-acyltransferase 1 isoform X2 [Lutra lutra]|uniref:2-acylglycerol O-acyltransferase 1 isoform X2 n=1 Tax=Lutra lutra TaxID=9657 RepID=UPI001FD490EB|nr:2-acylglycerol O-acyltransferase 1 isoform X2 [Lutra lutra]
MRPGAPAAPRPGRARLAAPSLSPPTPPPDEVRPPPATRASPPLPPRRPGAVPRGAGTRPLTPPRLRDQQGARSRRSPVPGRSMKVEFAPLNIPLARRLQTAAVLQWVLSFLLLAQVCIAVIVILIVYNYWFLYVPYMTWLYFDWSTPEQGGRRSNWVRSWTVWRYFKDYFPIHLIKTWDLDPSRNYIFGFHPHGVLVAGAFGNFCTNYSDFEELFPGFTAYLHVLPFWFRCPLFRDYLMTSGSVSVSKKSVSHVLSKEGGGNISVIVLGGAEESLDAHPGKFTLFIRQRKGFVKIALTHGASLVPVFSFGENELFKQVNNPEGSWLRTVQEKLQKIMGFALPLFHARGIFQYNFGLMPYRKPIHTVGLFLGSNDMVCGEVLRTPQVLREHRLVQEAWPEC